MKVQYTLQWGRRRSVFCWLLVNKPLWQCVLLWVFNQKKICRSLSVNQSVPHPKFFYCISWKYHHRWSLGCRQFLSKVPTLAVARLWSYEGWKSAFFRPVFEIFKRLQFGPEMWLQGEICIIWCGLAQIFQKKKFFSKNFFKKFEKRQNTVFHVWAKTGSCWRDICINIGFGKTSTARRSKRYMNCSWQFIFAIFYPQKCGKKPENRQKMT